MSDREGILDTTRELLRRQLRSPDLDLPETRLLRELAEDSLDLIEITFVIEEHFRVELPAPSRDAASDLTEAADWSLGDLVDWIAGRVAGPPAMSEAVP
jgi:acyl carrier protein